MGRQCGGLTAEQLERFDADGYVAVDGVFQGDDLQPVIDEITAEIDSRAEDLVGSGELTQTYAELDFEHRLAAISRETDKLARSIWDGQLAGPGFFDLIRNPRLLDIAEQLCGPELIASSVYRLRPKIPHYDHGAVPWHQDSGYFDPYCDKALVLTVWLPLVDATPERGCMWLQPGVHKGGVFTHKWHRSGYLEISREDGPDVEPVCVPVMKGGALLLTNRTPHATFENTSDVVRWSMDLRYQSAALPTNAQVTRLEGETIASEASGVPAACYPPEADFLVRSRERPGEVVRDAAVFRAIRTSHRAAPWNVRW